MQNTMQHNHYTLQKKVFKILGASFKIFDENENLCFFVNQKAFKLREDIRIYHDEAKTQEVLLIKARNIVDFSAVYDIFDSQTNEHIGALKRKGFKSMIKDEWIIMDSIDQEMGLIKEDSMALALLRRFITALIPQTFVGFLGETRVFAFKQRFNPFILKIDLDFSDDSMHLLDRRIGICAAVLLGAIEGRQDN